jgi:hypothetical protein
MFRAPVLLMSRLLDEIRAAASVPARNATRLAAQEILRVFHPRRMSGAAKATSSLRSSSRMCN